MAHRPGRARPRLLLAGLPPTAVDGAGADRPTAPSPAGELPAHRALNGRLSRIGRFGSTLVCNLPCHRAADDEGHDGTRTTAPEDRLFFDYLRGDFSAAAADLEAMEPQLVSPAHRLSSLTLRGQILWSQGEQTRARAIVDYLLLAEGGELQRVEETPLGLFLTREASPRQAWARYLSVRIAQGCCAALLAPGRSTEKDSIRTCPTRSGYPIDRWRSRFHRFRGLTSPGARSGRIAVPVRPEYSRCPYHPSRSIPSDVVVSGKDHVRQPPLSHGSYRTVNSTIRAAWMTRVRSSGVIALGHDLLEQVERVVDHEELGDADLERLAVLRQEAEDVADGHRLGHRVIRVGLPTGDDRRRQGVANHLMDHLGDGCQLGIIERPGRIVGRVIARILAGREEEERDAAAAKRAVIAAIEDQQVRAEKADVSGRPRAAARSRAAVPGHARCP